MRCLYFTHVHELNAIVFKERFYATQCRERIYGAIQGAVLRDAASRAIYGSEADSPGFSGSKQPSGKSDFKVG